MVHLPKLIEDLAIILCTAAFTTIIFRWLKQPVVLGYILAGVLVGTDLPFVPSVSDREGIKIWAEIGVIFLLFSLGLEFSFKKLAKVWGNAAIAGIVEISCMLAAGYFTGQLMGWPVMDSIFLGGIIAISSTTIIIKAFDELRVKNRNFAGLVLGILIIEDLVAVLLLVILSTISVKRGVEGTELLMSIFKLVFFLSIWFLSGIFLLPTILKKFKKVISDETMLIVSVGLCFLMVVFAVKVGFSAPLGAFIMGSIMAESTQAEKIEKLVKSSKNLFGAVFFVSVGLLIRVEVLVEYAVPVLILTMVVMAGKTIFVTFGALLAGKPLKQSVQAGMSLSQIGEFSFIIATLGLTLGVISDYLYPIAVGVSVITTFFTPYMIRAADKVYYFIEDKLPYSWARRMNRYVTSSAQTIQAASDWKIVLKSFMVMILVNSVLIIGLILLGTQFLYPFVASKTDNYLLARVVTVIIVLIAMLPFLWALTIKKIQKSAYRKLWLDRKYNRGPLVMLEIFRNLLAVVFLFILLAQLFETELAFVIALVVMIVVIIIFSKRLQRFYARLEDRFLLNLHTNHDIEGMDDMNNISPWDAHLAFFEIPPHADFAGIPLEDLKWREKYGINIANIKRGLKVINVPSRHNMLFPYDKIGVIGTDEQLQVFRYVIEPKVQAEEIYSNGGEISLHKVVLSHKSKINGVSIHESELREKSGGLVVGIERDGKRILNPDSNIVFQVDDVVWIVGDEKKIREFTGE